MTPITRPRSAARAAVLTAVLPLLLGVLAAIGPASPAAAEKAVDPLDQHVFVHTETAAGMTRDPIFFGRWDPDGAARPELDLQGSNEIGNITRFRADSPAPQLAHSRGNRFCVVQKYRSRTFTGLAERTSYRTTVTVRRDGHRVLRRTVRGSYRSSPRPTGSSAAPRVVRKDRVRLGDFSFRRDDRVTWVLRGTLTNQVKKFTSRATISPRC